LLKLIASATAVTSSVSPNTSGHLRRNRML
jgi:hypothetical protein